MTRKRGWFAGGTAIMIGLAAILVIAAALFVFGVFAPQTLQVAGGLPACESDEVGDGVRDFMAAQDGARAESIVSIQEIARDQGLEGGPVVRRTCQVSLRTPEGYERVVLDLAAEGGADGAAWHLSLGQLAEPPVAAPVEGLPRPSPDTLPVPEEQQ